MVHWLYTLAICCWWCSCSHRALLLWLHGFFLLSPFVSISCSFFHQPKSTAASLMHFDFATEIWSLCLVLFYFIFFCVFHLFYFAFYQFGSQWKSLCMYGCVCVFCFHSIYSPLFFFLSVSPSLCVRHATDAGCIQWVTLNFNGTTKDTRKKKTISNFWWEYISSLVRC